MNRSVEFDLLTKIEANARFASRQGMFEKSRRTALQRAVVKAVLAAHFGAMVPPRYVQQGPTMMANRIEVKLTRISPGRTADAWENLRGALKGVKDEVAAWIGIDDREGAGITWLDPGQEQQGPAVYRVRLEITDQSPGPDLVVVLAETASEARKAKARVKRMVKQASSGGANGRHVKGSPVKVHHGVHSYQPEAAARGASSAARSKAEAAWSKMAVSPALKMPDAEGRERVAAYHREHPPANDKPTALDLRDAAERVLSKPRASDGCHERPSIVMALDQMGRSPDPVPSQQALEREEGRFTRPPRDPGEERPARDLAPCTTCGVRIGEPCESNVRAGCSPRLVYGVHVARAIAAGLPVPDDDRAMLKPKRTATGPRKPAMQVPLPAYMRAPWTVRHEHVCACGYIWAHEAPPKPATCPNDGGALQAKSHRPLTRWEAGDKLTGGPARIMVPTEHVARFGSTVTLRRHERESPKLGKHVVYE